jgi:IS605 OrfB family transposase
MITIKLNIKSISDVEYVKEKQLNYSYCFRKLYKNISKFDDLEYLKQLKAKFNLTEIELRSIIFEVKNKHLQNNSLYNNIKQSILNIQNEIIVLNELPKSKKVIRKIFKLNKLLSYKKKSLNNDIVFGSRDLLKQITYLNNNKIENELSIKNKKLEYQTNRILPIYFLGEANRIGNRFFKFDLLNNKIIYKPNRNTKIYIEFSNYKSYKNDLINLQELIESKDISVSVRLSTKYIYLIYDDEKLNGYNFDNSELKLIAKEIKKDSANEEIAVKLIKDLYSKYHKELDHKKLSNKLSYRYLAIDSNPDYIGCSILDKIGDDNFKIIYTFSYDLTALNAKLPKEISKEERTHINNKRKHGITHIWKNVFEIFTYYKCGYLVIEDLNFKSKINLDNKHINRRINNVWHRELSTNLINKYCNKLGIIKIEVNPCYTSFIGNMNNDYTDPINASIEIGRRGMFKYIKNKFYPQMDMNTIMDTMSRLNKSRDVSFLKDHSSWVELYRDVRKEGLRYRFKLEDVTTEYNLNNKLNHSMICKYAFK